MNNKFSALTITGSNSRDMAKEVFNTCYELTKTRTDGKKLTEEETKEILSLSIDDLTRDKLFSLFANTFNNGKRKNARFNTYDTMTIPSNYFDGQNKTIETTIGRFIFNKYILESSGIIRISGFRNEEMGKKGLSNLDSLIGNYYLNDLIDRKQFNMYIDRRDCIGLQLNGILANTISPKMAKPLPSVEKYKKELIKQNEDKIKQGNIDVMKYIENELIRYAKEELKDDPGMELYNSGDLSFENNYKNNSIIKGPVENKLEDKFDFISTSFMDGMEIKDQPAHANSVVASVFPSAIKTGTAGYLAKKLLMTMQMVEIDEPGTDCGTKQTIPIHITKQNASSMIYKYFVNDAGKLEQITPENVKSYIGKTLNCRSPMTCISPKICSKCASDLFYKLDIRNIGLASVAMSHADLNLNLKAKHDATINLYDIDTKNITE